MAIFAPANTTGYRDPMQAMTIKALEQRQKDLLAQQAAEPAITPENTQTPVQAFGHIANALGDSFRQRRADAAISARRDELTKAMTGYDPSGDTPPPVAVAGGDPELYKSLMTQWSETRRAKAQQAADMARDTAKYGYEEKAQGRTEAFQGTQKGLDREQTADLAKQQRELTQSESNKQIQATRDLATDAQVARADLRKADRDVEVAQKELDRQHSIGTQQTQIEATKALEAAKAGYATALANVNNAHSAEQADKTRAATKENQGTQIAATTALATQQQKATADLAAAEREFKGAQAALDRTNQDGTTQQKIDATANLQTKQHEFELAKQAAQNAFTASQPKSDIGGVAADVNNPALKIDPAVGAAAQQKLVAPDPKRAEAIATAKSTYAAHSQALEKLETAQQLLKDGINTGPWADLQGSATLRAEGVPVVGGMVSKEAADRARRTVDFNSIVNLNTIKEMSATLKGQDSNYEMQKFIEVLNNPSASPKMRQDALDRAARAAQVGKMAHAAALKSMGVDTGEIDTTLKGGGGGGSGGGALSEAQNAINQGAPFEQVAARAKAAGLDISGLKQKGQ